MGKGMPRTDRWSQGRIFPTNENQRFYNSHKCNLQVKQLFSDSKTMDTLVNYTCKRFMTFTPSLRVEQGIKIEKHILRFLMFSNFAISVLDMK